MEPTIQPFGRSVDRLLQRHKDTHIVSVSSQQVGYLLMPMDVSGFPAGRIVPHPETISLFFFQDDQHGFAGSYHRLFFKDLPFTRIAFGMFRPRRNIAVSKTS